MNGRYECEDSLKQYMADKTGVELRNVEQMVSMYNELMDDEPYQYLAHIIRTLESFVRKKTVSPKFRIICIQTKDAGESISGLACARYKKGSSFTIVYDGSIDDNQKRISIAHELGHLFLAVAKSIDYDGKHEPLSSLFGMITMLHKNSVAGEKQTEKETKVVDDFTLVMNRIMDVYNKSN